MKSFKRIEPYIYIVTAFALDLFILAYGTLRQLILPTRYRKGNLLSSLFHLFTDLSERLIALKQELTRFSWNYGKKYLRLGMLVLTWALFILSSFEWIGSGQKSAAAREANLLASAQETIQTTCPKTICYSYNEPRQSTVIQSYQTDNISLPTTTRTPQPPKRWLILRKLLI